MSPILVTLTSRSGSDFEGSIISFKENKPDGVNPNSNGLTTAFERTKEKFYGFQQTFFSITDKRIHLFYAMYQERQRNDMT